MSMAGENKVSMEDVSSKLETMNLNASIKDEAKQESACPSSSDPPR